MQGDLHKPVPIAPNPNPRHQSLTLVFSSVSQALASDTKKLHARWPQPNARGLHLFRCKPSVLKSSTSLEPGVAQRVFLQMESLSARDLAVLQLCLVRLAFLQFLQSSCCSAEALIFRDLGFRV